MNTVFLPSPGASPGEGPGVRALSAFVPTNTDHRTKDTLTLTLSPSKPRERGQDTGASA